MDIDNQYGMLKTQQYYLPLISAFHEYCCENDIKYSLSYGSLLGAVRHKGFIPWDDDIDVMFDRPNYEKFLNAFTKKQINNVVLIGKLWIKKISFADNPLIEKEGNCIDLFVLDGVPENKGAAKIKVFMLKALQGMMKEKPDYKNYSLLFRILSFITHISGRLFKLETKQKWYEQLSQWTGRKPGEYINIYNGLYSQIGSKKYRKEIIDDYTEIGFEGMKLLTVSGYDSYLHDLYGDYMKLPPVSERVNKHEISSIRKVE